MLLQTTLAMDCTLIIVLVLVSVAIISFIARSNQNQAQAAHQARLRAIDLAAIDSMDGVSFEHYVAELLRHEGFFDVAVSKASGDFGVDVVASRGGKKYAIQVKRYTGSVSRRAISDAVAGMSHYGCNAAMVITNSYLSKPAMQFAASVGCTIVNRDQLGEWIIRYQGASRSVTTPLAQPIAPVSQQAEPNAPTNQPKITKPDLVRESEVPQNSTPARKPPEPQEDAILPEIKEQIKQRAAREWPKDYSMQAYEVDKQLKAYAELDTLRRPTVPAQIRDRITGKAADEWPDNYSMQAHTIAKQLNDYETLLRFAPSTLPPLIIEEIKSNAAREWPYDYCMQLHTAKAQARAWRSLQ